MDEVHALFVLLEELMPRRELTETLVEMTVTEDTVFNVRIPGLPTLADMAHVTHSESFNKFAIKH